MDEAPRHWDGRQWLRWDGDRLVPEEQWAAQDQGPSGLAQRKLRAAAWFAQHKGLSLVGGGVLGLLLLGALGSAVGGTGGSPGGAPAAPVSSSTSTTPSATPSATSGPVSSPVTSTPATSAPTTQASVAAPVTVTTTSPPAAPAPSPSRTTTTRTTPRPSTSTTPAVAGVVHAGAFCSSDGAIGYTSAGTRMVCTTTATDSRLRWRRA